MFLGKDPMAGIRNGRFTAQIEGDFVVFLIGMRINRPLMVHKWFPVAQAMPRMLQELNKNKEMGLLEAQGWLSGRTVMVLQYWRSFEQLHAYAHARDLEHLPAWAAFNRRVGGNGAVGIFHETYVVKSGTFETVYANMPPFGLAKAGVMVPAIGRLQTAQSRMDPDSHASETAP